MNIWSKPKIPFTKNLSVVVISNNVSFLFRKEMFKKKYGKIRNPIYKVNKKVFEKNILKKKYKYKKYNTITNLTPNKSPRLNLKN